MFILKFGSKIFVKASDNIKHVSLSNACFDVGEFLYITVSSNVVILLIYDGVISFPSVESLQYAVVSSLRYTSLVPKARDGLLFNWLLWDMKHDCLVSPDCPIRRETILKVTVYLEKEERTM